jgi:ribosomal protein S18 acetylase RimI-like enzyme
VNLRPLSALDTDAQVALVNRAYEGYLVEVRFDAAALASHVERNDIDAGASLALFEDGVPLAVGALARRGTRGWIGGFGVVPERRGAGLGRALGEGLLQRARDLGLTSVALEVLVDNHAAIELYRRLGFATERDVVLLARDAESASGEGDDAPAATLIAAGEGRTPRSPWQREPSVLRRVDGLSGLCLGDPQAPYAALLWSEGPGGVAVWDAWGSEAGVTELARELAARRPRSAARMLNEPDGSPAHRGLLAAGWRETGRQHEMTIAP